MTKAKLYLIPTVLGESGADSVIPNHVLELSRRLKYFIAENDKTARRYLKSIGTEIPLDDLEFEILNKHTKVDDIGQIVKRLKQGHEVGLISEAGMPGIADPGQPIVSWCHRNNIKVVPLVGPSSILLALIASGFNGQSFAFHGYLPIEKRERHLALRSLETELKKTGQTQIFMETPFRNEKLLDQVLKSCNPTTHLCIAVDITLSTEQITTFQVGEWKKKNVKLHKRPAIFLFGNPA